MNTGTMTKDEFHAWLSGFVTACGEEITQDQWREIVSRISTVRDEPYRISLNNRLPLQIGTVTCGTMDPLGAEFESVWDQNTDRLYGQ